VLPMEGLFPYIRNPFLKLQRLTQQHFWPSLY
jgi:hypothetical protein